MSGSGWIEDMLADLEDLEDRTTEVTLDVPLMQDDFGKLVRGNESKGRTGSDLIVFVWSWGLG